MFTQKNKLLFTLVVAFLSSIASTLSVNARELAQQGKIRPTDSELYVRKAVGSGGNGTVNLLEGLANSEVGISNFDGQRLDADRYFVVNALTVNYGVAATGTSAAAVNYTTALPAGLKCANVVIKQDNEVLFRIPIASINESKSSDTRYRELGAFSLIRDQKTVRVEIEFPDGTDLAPGAGNAGYVEVLLSGFETYIKR